ncbi:MAG: hypothetical protein ACLPID_02995 [Beijerinckiaceae bacterium]
MESGTFIDLIMQLVPYFIVSIAFAWGNYYLAVKSGKNGVLYVVLTLIPLVGSIVSIYLFYRTVIYLLDRVAAK